MKEPNSFIVTGEACHVDKFKARLSEAVYIGGKLKRAVVYMYDAETGISRLKVVNPIDVKLAPSSQIIDET